MNAHSKSVSLDLLPTGCHVVWFKRDLRLHDHAALSAAAAAGPVLCIYVFEPEIWRQPDTSGRQWHFIQESLVDLNKSLRQRGGTLLCLMGEIVDQLEAIHRILPIQGLYAHEETGNDQTFQRDKAVGQWCRMNGVGWHEFRQFGVTRHLRSRDDWKDHWEAHTEAEVLPVPLLRWSLIPEMKSKTTWTGLRVCLAESMPDFIQDDPYSRQHGGRREAVKIFKDFLSRRSQSYRGGISSPLSATSACSRISAHLAYGCLSMREVVQAARRQLAKSENLTVHHRRGLEAFVSRLYWHCHFIQKFESQPDIEHFNMHRGYDGLRESGWSETNFEALVNARTGWPLVDACVMMLRQTGWLNFRMRAMLVSVASYALWLHWRRVGQWLASQFTDYEPGIHWSQMQMQAGTTGINTTRVYNPIKQARDHDPNGYFVRHWLPYMRQVPDAWIFEPWRMPDSLQQLHGLKPGVDIPVPVVDFEIATREAKSRVYAVRQDPDNKAEKKQILEKHGSRRRLTQNTRRSPCLQSDQAQLRLELL